MKRAHIYSLAILILSITIGAADLTAAPGPAFPPAVAPVVAVAAPVANELVFERENGTEIEFPPDTQTWVWCGDWEDDLVPVPTMHVFVFSSSGPGWYLRIVLGDVTLDQPITFPNSWTWPNPENAEFFLYDPPNELSTDQQDASGFIEFQQLDCGTGGGVQFSIDAVLGSEFGDGPTVAVIGNFSAELTGRLAVPAQSWGTLKAQY